MWYEKRNHLPYVLHALQIDKPYVEVGFQHGHHADVVKAVWNSSDIIGVDNYLAQPLDEYPDGSNCPQSKFDEIFEYASKRHSIIKKDSLTASKDFEDNSLGCVYIDANHSAKAVYQDMEAWWPKIGNNGIMCGHDYMFRLSSDKKTWFGVLEGVHKWAEEKGLTVFDAEEDWYILKQPFYQPNEVLVVSNFYGNWPKEVIDNHKKYCNRFGYNYACYNEEPPKGRFPTWSKIPALLRACKEYPEAKYIQWVDADIVFMNPRPLHSMAFQRPDFVCAAYKTQAAPNGTINTCWFGFPNTDKSYGILSDSFNFGYEVDYPHEEGALTKMLNARANDNVWLFRVDQVAPTMYFTNYDPYKICNHVIGLHKHTRKSVIQDMCFLSKV